MNVYQVKVINASYEELEEQINAFLRENELAINEIVDIRLYQYDVLQTVIITYKMGSPYVSVEVKLPDTPITIKLPDDPPTKVQIVE